LIYEQNYSADRYKMTHEDQCQFLKFLKNYSMLSIFELCKK
jgi:hypothetical protein